MTMYYYIKWLITNDTLQFNSFYQALYHKEDEYKHRYMLASSPGHSLPPPEESPGTL